MCFSLLLCLSLFQDDHFWGYRLVVVDRQEQDYHVRFEGHLRAIKHEPQAEGKCFIPLQDYLQMKEIVGAGPIVSLSHPVFGVLSFTHSERGLEIGVPPDYLQKVSTFFLPEPFQVTAEGTIPASASVLKLAVRPESEKAVNYFKKRVDLFEKFFKTHFEFVFPESYQILQSGVRTKIRWDGDQTTLTSRVWTANQTLFSISAQPWDENQAPWMEQDPLFDAPFQIELADFERGTVVVTYDIKFPQLRKNSSPNPGQTVRWIMDPIGLVDFQAEVEEQTLGPVRFEVENSTRPKRKKLGIHQEDLPPDFIPQYRIVLRGELAYHTEKEGIFTFGYPSGSPVWIFPSSWMISNSHGWVLIDTRKGKTWVNNTNNGAFNMISLRQQAAHSP